MKFEMDGPYGSRYNMDLNGDGVLSRREIAKAKATKEKMASEGVKSKSDAANSSRVYKTKSNLARRAVDAIGKAAENVEESANQAAQSVSMLKQEILAVGNQQESATSFAAKVTGIVHRSLASQIDNVRATLAREARKHSENAARLVSDLEAKGVISTGSFVEDLKNGSIHFKDYYVNLPSLMVALVLMKSMRYVVETGPATTNSALTLSSLTSWLKGEGDASFNANATLPAVGLHPACTVAGGRLEIDLDTADVAAFVKLADVSPTRNYVATIIELANGAIVATSTRIGVVMNGAQLLDMDLIDQDDWERIAGIQGVPLPADGVYAVCAYPLDLASTSMRITGALDLAGAVKAAGVVVAGGLNEWAGIIYPFIANSIGNLLTKSESDKLYDFFSKK